MKKRLLLLVLSSLAITSCQTINTNSTPGGQTNIIDRIDIDSLTNFQLVDVVRVYYNGNINPFDYKNYKFSSLLVNEEKIEKLFYSEETIKEKYFDIVLTNKDVATYDFTWEDENNNAYLEGSTRVVYNDKLTRPSSQLIDDNEPVDPPVVVEPDDLIYPEGYSTLVFNDEFDGDSIDNRNWDYDIGNGNNGWGNGESQYYTKENATVSDGVLHIAAKRENKESFNYTSSRLVTRGRYSFKYGYVEARISLPEVAGMWPAFWMLPEENVYGYWPFSGEIDIMEAKGRWTNKSSSALHFTTSGGGHTYETHEQTYNEGTMSKYHTYACEWSERYIRFLVDGESHLTVNYYDWQTSKALNNELAPFDQKFHIILNLAIGGHFDGYTLPPSSFTGCLMNIDYVRVFQK